MILTYWYAQNLIDSDSYSIRERTKREAQKERREQGPEDYGPVVKVSVDYDSGFDLMLKCSGEDPNHWEKSYQCGWAQKR